MVNGVDNQEDRIRLRYDWVAVGIVFIFILSASLMWNIKTYPFDSSYYWSIANSMMGENGFSFLDFPETFRGYFYPFIMFVLKGTGRVVFNNDHILFMITNSAILAILIAKVIPIILDVHIAPKRRIIGSVLFSTIICIFWKDVITCPLSDLPAMAMFMTALALMQTATKQSFENKKKSIIKFLLYGFFCGALLYAAYNTRAVYQYAVILAGLVFLFINRKKPTKYLVSITIVALIGAALIAFPQAKINEKYTGKFTPRVMTEQLNNYSTNLEISQLHWGINIQRYESYTGSTETYNTLGGVMFSDETGSKILREENINIETFNIGALVKLYLKYPLDFAGIYTRHIFSYISNISDDVYSEEFYKDNSLKFLMNVLIWFIGALGIIVSNKNSRRVWLKKNGSYLLCIVLPCLMIIPGAPEVRFFISFYFLLYGYLCYQLNFHNIKSLIKSKATVVIGSFFAVLLVWTAIIGSILASVDNATLLIKNKPWVLEDQIYMGETVASVDKINLSQINDVNIWTTQFNVSANEYYYFKFETDAMETDTKLFYADLYAGAEYDKVEQDKNIVLNREDNHYAGIIYTGVEVPADEVQFRLITIPLDNIEINNLIVRRCEMKNRK